MGFMKRSATIFLQGVIAVFGLAVLAFLLWEPHVEGRNVNATTFEIYFHDPFLAYVYFGSIPFFVALFQAIKVLGYAGQNNVFSQANVSALRTIRNCALLIIGLAVISVAFMPFGDAEDRPPGVFLRLVVIFGSLVVATTSAIFERILQQAVDLKSENDLTI